MGTKKKKKKQKRKKEKPNSRGTKSDSASDSQEIKIQHPSKVRPLFGVPPCGPHACEWVCTLSVLCTSGVALVCCDWALSGTGNRRVFAAFLKLACCALCIYGFCLHFLLSQQISMWVVVREESQCEPLGFF